MSVTILRNFPDLRSFVFLNKDDWGAIGRVQRERIIDRTKAGRDVEGRAFQGYSPSYIQQLQKEGLGTAVDLEVSGAMLQAIVVEPDADGVTLRFSR